MRIALEDRVNDVSLVQAISHIDPSLEDLTDFLVRQSHGHLGWVKLLHSLPFLLFLCILVDLSLLLYLHSPQLLENSLYLIRKRAILALYLVNQLLDLQHGQSIVFGQPYISSDLHFCQFAFPRCRSTIDKNFIGLESP